MEQSKVVIVVGEDFEGSEFVRSLEGLAKKGFDLVFAGSQLMSAIMDAKKGIGSLGEINKTDEVTYLSEVLGKVKDRSADVWILAVGMPDETERGVEVVKLLR